MRELFDRLLAEGEAGIDRLVTERMQESVTLDFKEARGAGTGTLANEDRKTFGKALSAFANSAGGLLVFGVEARKGEDNIDCAQAAKPIANIARFKSEATTASGQLLQPRHDGILVEAIPSEKHPGAGYLLVHVERSERRPHRSEAAGQKQYFKRAGDSSFEMEHYDIEDAFKRSASPNISFCWRREKMMTFGDGREIWRVRFLLINESNKSATFPYLHVRDAYKFNSNPSMAQGFQMYHDGVWISYNGNADTVIHPGSQITPVLLSTDISIPVGSLPLVEDGTTGLFTAFDYRFGCLDTRPKTGRFELYVGQLSEMGAEICR